MAIMRGEKELACCREYEGVYSKYSRGEKRGRVLHCCVTQLASRLLGGNVGIFLYSRLATTISLLTHSPIFYSFTSYTTATDRPITEKESKKKVSLFRCSFLTPQRRLISLHLPVPKDRWRHRRSQQQRKRPQRRELRESVIVAERDHINSRSLHVNRERSRFVVLSRALCVCVQCVCVRAYFYNINLFLISSTQLFYSFHLF